MFLNDKKGSYGCFSNAGKSALKMYKNLVSNPLEKKPRTFNKFENLFGKNNQQLLNEFRKERELNDKGDIFKLDEYELKKLKELTKNKTNKKLKK